MNCSGFLECINFKMTKFPMVFAGTSYKQSIYHCIHLIERLLLTNYLKMAQMYYGDPS